MKLLISRIWAHIVALGFAYKTVVYIQFHHIKPSGYWAFSIVDMYDKVLYKNY